MRKELADYLRKVERMRAAQRAWFKTKDRSHLIQSKQLEMEVDLELPKLLTALEPEA